MGRNQVYRSHRRISSLQPSETVSNEQSAAEKHTRGWHRLSRKRAGMVFNAVAMIAKHPGEIGCGRTLQRFLGAEGPQDLSLG